MSNVRYTVEIVSESGAEDSIKLDDYAQVAAVRSAAAEAKKPENADKRVFLSFFRASDGQRGYIQPDGSSGINGVSY